MDYAVLFVDDDVRVLSALQRNLHKAYRIETAASATEALGAISRGVYAVVVSDLRMPGMDGIELLTRVKQVCPDAVRILLTGHADLDAAIAAVNEGNIFRFLSKPCPQEVLTKTLDAALEQYRLVTAEKELLHQTLMGTVAALVGVLAAVQPLALGRASQIAQYVRQLACVLKVSDLWEIEVAAMLSQIGCISLDPEVLKKYYSGGELSNVEMSHFLSHASVGYGLIRRIPRLHAVAQIIEHQHQSCGGAPLGLSTEAYAIALGAQLLRVAVDFDRLSGAGLEPAVALAEMRRNESEYNPEALAALERMEDGAGQWWAASEDGNDSIGALLKRQQVRPLVEPVWSAIEH
jgi:response regulator RpfG family c-di-GMP phosphodiesterase